MLYPYVRRKYAERTIRVKTKGEIYQVEMNEFGDEVLIGHADDGMTITHSVETHTRDPNVEADPNVKVTSTRGQQPGGHVANVN